MSVHRACAAGLMGLAILLTGCSRPGREAATQPLPAAPSQATAVLAESHAGEPSEEVLRDLVFKRYEKLKSVPLVLTATGEQFTVHPKLYEVRKRTCEPTPHIVEGSYECSVTIKLSLREDGRKPSEQGERIKVKRNDKGEWAELTALTSAGTTANR